MSKFIHKKHNVSVLMYHIVCPTKYRRAVFAARLMPRSKKFVPKSKSDMRSNFWKSARMMTMFIFSCRVCRCIVRNNWCKRSKASRHEKFSKLARKSRNTYGAANFGQTDISSAQSAHTERKK